jgi:hypothetical protein
MWLTAHKATDLGETDVDAPTATFPVRDAVIIEARPCCEWGRLADLCPYRSGHMEGGTS